MTKLTEILEAIKALPPEEMKDLVEGTKEVLYEKGVCSTCGTVMDRNRVCWHCYESGPYDRV